MVLLYEVHDRIHRKRLTFADGVRDPIEEIDHPLLEQEPVMVTDPLTGEVVLMTLRESRSGSVSLPRTSISTVVSWSVVAASSTATGSLLPGAIDWIM